MPGGPRARTPALHHNFGREPALSCLREGLDFSRAELWLESRGFSRCGLLSILASTLERASGVKARFLCAVIGTTEVVPFPFAVSPL